MEQQLRHNLTKCAITYSVHERISMSAVGHRALRDGTFFDRIQRSSFTVKTYDRVMKWFEQNWPEGLDWPDGVPRNEQLRGAA